MNTLKIGDLVKLKSGSPTMTVDAIRGSKGEFVVCVWFVGTEHKEAEFSPDALEPAPTAQKGPSGAPGGGGGEHGWMG